MQNTRLKAFLLGTRVTTVTAAKSALKPIFLTPCTIIKHSHFLPKEDTGYLEQFLAGRLSAWSQLHWQGAGPRSPESQRKEQFNTCLGTRLLLWWIISHARSQPASKSQRKHFSTGRLQHTAEGGPKVCNWPITSQISFPGHSPLPSKKEAVANCLQSEQQRPLLTLETYYSFLSIKIRGARELFPFKSSIVQ